MRQLEDIKFHTLMSWTKSMFRIGGYGVLLINIKLAVFILIVSEIIGIYEEKEDIYDSR